MSEVKIFELKLKVLEIFEQTCRMKNCHVKPRHCGNCIAMKHFKTKLKEL